MKKRDLCRAKSFLVLHLKPILYCPQLQKLIARFCTLKVGWYILMFSRSNLFYASDLILFLPPFFEQSHNRALSTQSLSASHIAQEPSWRFTAHSFLRPGSDGVFFLRGLQLRQVSGYGLLWFTCKTMWARSCLAFTALAVVVNAEFASLEIWTINCDVLI